MTGARCRSNWVSSPRHANRFLRDGHYVISPWRSNPTMAGDLHRRAHGFVFNTMILALDINILSGLRAVNAGAQESHCP
jgi:hypothetical protein